MNRTDFEAMSTKRQRAYAANRYLAISRVLFAENQENGIYFDEFGRLSEIHHIWPRSHCPLWYVFQPENLVCVSQKLHHTIHNVAPSEMSESEREYYDEFETIKNELIKENEAWTTSNF